MNKLFLDEYKSTNFKPFKEYCLIKPKIPEQEEVSNSGIVIEMKKDVINSRPSCGEVLSTGDSEKVSVGDVVVFPNTDGIDVKMEDGDYIILRIESIIGKI